MNKLSQREDQPANGGFPRQLPASNICFAAKTAASNTATSIRCPIPSLGLALPSGCRLLTGLEVVTLHSPPAILFVSRRHLTVSWYPARLAHEIRNAVQLNLRLIQRPSVEHLVGHRTGEIAARLLILPVTTSVAGWFLSIDATGSFLSATVQWIHYYTERLRSLSYFFPLTKAFTSWSVV